jgi:hypothetical protein
MNRCGVLFPSHHRKEGGVNKCREPPQQTQPGWFTSSSQRKTTRLAFSGGFAIRDRSHLLAVVQENIAIQPFTPSMTADDVEACGLPAVIGLQFRD